MKFLRESLQQLDSDLRGAGSGLTLLKGVIEKEIFRLANKHDAQKMYAEKEVAPKS
ncbi:MULTISPECIES: deoxyribodipyrimidine photo-lyase [unclassified Mucilaginibacter]|uniref:deoxyribodipyrimidine photo-lyase n=1 Tax=unclassified Mucilaginibacter TaxID=2617802 RepID=UPI002B23D5F6|nr:MULTISPECIES: deoxyribodipyrimidine photo-lyase [unclassified Mucilaginibacter]